MTRATRLNAVQRTGDASRSFSRIDCVVDSSLGPLAYATITDAIAGCPVGGTIQVRTSTSEQVVVTKSLTIEWVAGATLINPGDGDAIASSVAENVNGAISDVILRNPYIVSAVSGATVGTGLALASSGDTVTATAHGLVAGKQVTLSSIVSATGVSAGVTYYVVSPTANTFQLALTHGGSAVDITADGTATVTLLARSAGFGFNMHGTLRWRVHNARVINHAKGYYFSATPYPSGQGSHNTFYSAFAATCGVGVHFAGTANINTFVDLYTFNCSTHLWHQSGLNQNIFGYRCENLAGGTENMIRLDGLGARIYGLHAEGQGANPVLAIGLGSQGTIVEGNIYVTTGVISTIDNDSTTRYSIRLAGVPLTERSAARAQFMSAGRSESINATYSWTVLAAVEAMRIRGFSLLVGGFVNFSSGNFWTVDFYEYNGNSQVGSSLGTITQTAQWGLGPIKLTLASPYSLGVDRTIRVTFTRAGTAPQVPTPGIQVEWEH